MLFTKKDIEKLFSKVIANKIANGARFDFSRNDYISSEFKYHVDLISESGERIIIFAKTGEPTAFCSPNTGESVICERRYNSYNGYDKEDKVLYRFYQYKQVYTNSLEEFEVMQNKGSERDRRRYAKEQTTVTVIMYDGSQIECESIEVLGDRVIINDKEVIPIVCIQRIIAKK